MKKKEILLALIIVTNGGAALYYVTYGFNNVIGLGLLFLFIACYALIYKRS